MRETSPRALRKAATREAVIAAARGLFDRDGYEATTIRAIAAAAGMSTGAVFAHFEGKAELWAHLYGHPPITPEQAAALQARATEAEAALAVVRQSLTDQAAARADPTMPRLVPDVVSRLRSRAEATYALAEDVADRVEAHGLFLLCDWQDAARAAQGQATAA